MTEVMRLDLVEMGLCPTRLLHNLQDKEVNKWEMTEK